MECRYRAPAGHLCLKTSLPWVAFESSTAATSPALAPDLAAAPAVSGGGDAVFTEGDGGVSASGGATGGAVGASGTTLVPPVGVIMPGGGKGGRRNANTDRITLNKYRMFL